VDTLSKKRERYTSSPVVKGISVKRVTYVSRRDAIRVETLMTPAAKETNAVKEACAGLMGNVRPAAGMTSHAVKTIPAARVFSVGLIQNAMRAEVMISAAVKGISARNGLSVVQTASVFRAEVMRSSAVKKICAERAMCVDQRGYASHVEAMKNHAVSQISFFHQQRGQGMFAMRGTSVVQMTGVIPAAAMTSPVAKERSAKKVTSVEPMEYVTHVANTSPVRVISATRVTTMTIPMQNAINMAIWATAVGRETDAMDGSNAPLEYASTHLRQM